MRYRSGARWKIDVSGKKALMFIVVLGTAIHRAEAFVGTSAAVRRRIVGSCSASFRQSSRSICRISSSTRLQQLFASNGDDHVNGEGSPNAGKQKDNQKRQPQTGWNHKLPSEGSDFWKGPRDEKASAKDESPDGERFRTGWLHNTQKLRAENEAASKANSAAKDTVKKGSPVNMARRRLELAKLQQERNHRIICPPTLHAGGEDQLLAVTEHLISVPLYRDGRTSNKRIDVFFTVVEKVPDEDTRNFLQLELGTTTGLSDRQRAERYVERAALQNADSMVLYLQGGPGFAAPRPAADLGITKGCGSWADAALHKHGYSRIVLMDQRGTGKSTPVTKQTLKQQFPNLFLLDEDNDIEHNCREVCEFQETHPNEVAKVKTSVVDVTDYLAQFRANNIVQDAEHIREALMLETLSEDADDDVLSKSPRPWGCSLGQSYGGFCQATYLSSVEYPPKVMLFTGGIPPMNGDLKDLYSALWDRVDLRNRLYYEMYPGDIAAVKTIVRKLIEQPARLPSGGRLSARRFLTLGIELGGSPSVFASFHELISSAFVGGPYSAASGNNLANLEFTKAFLMHIDSRQSFDNNPLYFWLHESIYDFVDKEKGVAGNATNWAAQEALRQNEFYFDYYRTSELDDNEQPTLFYGEHVAEWMPQDYAGLSGIGLQLVASAVAKKADWDSLYDLNHIREVLTKGRTRAAAAVYHDDMYVDFNESMEMTRKRFGYLDIGKVLVTNEYQHSGLRDDGAALFSKLHGMAKGGIRIPS